MDLPETLKAQAEKGNKNVYNILVHSSADNMKILKAMLENGNIKPTIYKTFDFEDMANAHRDVELGRTVGKVIVTLG